ncbi:MAG: hypothetical protein MJK18_00135 [Bdellovibrionales bacterium]|nr:hypothetical protein [Bdellovibrionales bacterium]
MNSLKSSISFFGMFALFSLPILFVYQAPKNNIAPLKVHRASRGIASQPSPATKRCETIQRVRWRCGKGEEGKKDCHRDGFDNVRSCRPL